MADQSSQAKKTHNSWVRRLLWDFAALVVMCAVIMMGVYLLLQSQVPDVKALADTHLQVPMRIFSQDGKLMGEFGDKRRDPIAFDQIPPLLIKAVLATEDARFYEHSGVDFFALARAAVAVIKTGRKSQGGGTITMQVARNYFLTRKKTLRRKLIEIMIAIKIDNTFSKDKILSLYLNKIYFGSRAYGVASAAEVYYGCKLHELTLAQIAMIAGLPQAPSRNNPIRNPKAALERRHHVLDRMLELHDIDKAAYDQAMAAPVTAKYHRLQIDLHAPYVAESVRQALHKHYGKNAYEMGIDAYTTIDSKQQLAAEAALQKGLMAYTKRHGYVGPKARLPVDDYDHWQERLATYPDVSHFPVGVVISVAQQSVQVLLKNGDEITIPWAGLSWARPALPNGKQGKLPEKADDILKPGDVIRVEQSSGGNNASWSLSSVPVVQGALVALNPDTGAIQALVGGFDFKLSAFNRALQAKRQPGSSFKPFIYSAALHSGLTLASMVNDAPVILEDSGENKYWRPENDTHRFYGPTMLLDGLTHSRNLVSIRLLQRMGVEPTVKYISRFGFDPDHLPHSLSLALGSAELTPLQLAQGYSVFANGGFMVPAHILSRVVMQDTLVWQFKAPQVGPSCWGVQTEATQACQKAVITPQNAYLMSQAMQDVVQHGTGRRARVLKRHDLSGKTGTTNKQVDAWFAGFNRHLVTVVWVGFDSMKSIHEYGAQAALPIWIDFMGAALSGTTEDSLPQPSDIVAVRINRQTGQVDSSKDAKTRLMYFRADKVPKADDSDDIEDDIVPDAPPEPAHSARPKGESTAEEDIF